MPNLVLPQGSIASFLNDDVEQLVGLSDRTLQLPSIRCKSEGRTLRYQLEPRRRFLACRPQNHNGGSPPFCMHRVHPTILSPRKQCCRAMRDNVPKYCRIVNNRGCKVFYNSYMFMPSG
jgi:hypothetical protein